MHITMQSARNQAAVPNAIVSSSVLFASAIAEEERVNISTRSPLLTALVFILLLSTLLSTDYASRSGLSFLADSHISKNMDYSVSSDYILHPSKKVWADNFKTLVAKRLL